MEIRPDQIEGVRQNEQQSAKRTKQPQQAFGDLLDEEVTKATGQSQSGTAIAPPIANPLLQTQAVSQVGAVESTTESAVNQMDGLLDKWDEYAGQLGSSDLKQAYGSLESIADGVNRIREENPNMAESNPGLNQVVNELDAMATTERFKFNRGDYV